jgi:hypothetical protein
VVAADTAAADTAVADTAVADTAVAAANINLTFALSRTSSR